MVWVLEKEVFYHILDLGFEAVGIPVRVKFEFEIKEGALVDNSLSYRLLFNRQAILNRYPNLKSKSFENGIEKTIKKEIQQYFIDNQFIQKDAAPIQKPAE